MPLAWGQVPFLQVAIFKNNDKNSSHFIKHSVLLTPQGHLHLYSLVLKIKAHDWYTEGSEVKSRAI